MDAGLGCSASPLRAQVKVRSVDCGPADSQRRPMEDGGLRLRRPECRSATAMAPPPLLTAATAVLLLLLPMTSLPVSAMDAETCFFRQHQNVNINIRLAANKAMTAAEVRAVRSEQACVRACCSEEVKPGAKCNMAVFKANQEAGLENCFLFHCQTEQDCPLMKAQDNVNTYDIYKGLVHPTTVRPVTMVTTRQLTTSTTPAPPSTIKTTTQNRTPTTTTTVRPEAPPITTAETPPATTKVPPIPIAVTLPASPPPPPPTTMTTTSSQTTTSKTMSTTSVTMTLSSTAAPPAVFSSKKINKTIKKQNKIVKKVKQHPVTATRLPQISTTSLPVVAADTEAVQRMTGQPQPTPAATSVALPTSTTTSTTTIITTTTSTTRTTPTTTTTTTTPATTTSTTAPPTSTTTTTPTTTTTTTTITTESTTVRTTVPDLLIVPKDAAWSQPTLQNSSAGRGKAAVEAPGAVKSGLVAFMVLALAVLTLALAVGGRKAMESFDRRHYTRLELNDLHYEV